MPTKLHVLSYNIHKGFAAGNKQFVLSSIKDAIRKVDADLVFLQEVLGEHEEHARKIESWPTTSQFEFLADAVWPHHAYGRNAIYDNGHHGNAVLSKFRIVDWSNEDVSTNSMEKRGILHATIKIPDEPLPLHCLCIHFGLTRAGRKIQLEKLCAKIRKTIPTAAPLLVAGDFNDWPLSASKILFQSAGLIEVFKHTKGRHAATFPAFFPFLHLDRIYVRGLKVISAKILRGTPWNKLSDHAAVQAELEIDYYSLKS